MRITHISCSLISILVVVLSSGCKSSSIVDFENPELPSELHPNEVSQEVRKRYSIDGVFVIPSIIHTRLESGDPGYEVRVDAFYEEPVEVEIKELSLTIDGKPVVLEYPFSDRLMDNFRYSNDYRAYHAYISSPPFSIEVPEDAERLHVILTIEVKKGNGIRKSGSLEATFKPRKRTYIFPQA